MINPRTNVTDDTTLGGLGTGLFKWAGIAYASSVDMLFAAPFNAEAVLMIDPRTNVTDNTTLSGLGPRVGACAARWWGIAYASSVDMLFAAPQNTDAVLMINPRTNVTDITTLRVGSGITKWLDIAFAPSVDTLFAAPFDADAVLSVRFVVDLSVVEAPLREISELTYQLITTRDELSSSSAAIISMQASLASFDAAQSTMQAELSAVGNTVCNRPVCAAGTRPENGACVPDCTDLDRRGLSCEPHCDAALTDATSGGSPSSPVGLVAGIALGGGVAVAIAVVVYRRRALHREYRAEHPAQIQATAMYVNPLHTGSALTAAVSNEAFAGSSTVGDVGSGAVVLDEGLYVAQPASTDAAGVYSLFLSDRVEHPPQYHVFKNLHATAGGDRDEAA
jgi:hypothetical protein